VSAAWEPGAEYPGGNPLAQAVYEAVRGALLATAAETRTRADLAAERTLAAVLACVADAVDHDAATTTEARRRTILHGLAHRIRTGTLPTAPGSPR